jgi:fermentation-respiration switch protein FrsA (DUF1100 family)
MRIQTLLLSLSVLLILGAAATWLAGSSLIAVRRQNVGPAPWPQAQAVSLAAGPLGKPLAKLLLLQLPLRLSIQPAQLHPIARLPDLKAPLLIASGSADRHTTLAETQRLFAAAPEPKSLWIVDGAEHVDLHAYAPAEYERRIGGFLALHLTGETLANP